MVLLAEALQGNDFSQPHPDALAYAKNCWGLPKGIITKKLLGYLLPCRSAREGTRCLINAASYQIVEESFGHYRPMDKISCN